MISLLQNGFSEKEIVRSSQWEDKNRNVAQIRVGFEQNHTRRPPRTPAYAVTDANLDAIKKQASACEVEDGFPCAHRRSKEHLVDPNITFTKLYDVYEFFQS